MKKEDVLEKQTNNCFIITPIGEPNTDIRREIDGVINTCLKPVLERFKYKTFVAHEITTIGSINNQVLQHIYNDELVIANLTNLNPNVMYELAFRHAIHKPVIMIKNINDNHKIPFDIKDDRIIFYTNDFGGVKELEKNLINFIKELSDSQTNDNPIIRAIHDYNARKLFENSSNIDEANNSRYILARLDSIDKKIALQENGYQIWKKEYSFHGYPALDYNFLISEVDEIFTEINSNQPLNEDLNCDYMNRLEMLKNRFDSMKYNFSGRDKEEFYYKYTQVIKLLNGNS